MRPPRTFTRTEGYALIDAHTGARLSVDHLVTHQGLYHWNEAADVWELARAERIIKASGAAGTFVWANRSKTFVRRAV